VRADTDEESDRIHYFFGVLRSKDHAPLVGFSACSLIWWPQRICRLSGCLVASTLTCACGFGYSAALAASSTALPSAFSSTAFIPDASAWPTGTVVSGTGGTAAGGSAGAGSPL